MTPAQFPTPTQTIATDTLADLHALAFADSRGWSAAEFDSLLASPHCYVMSFEEGFALGRVVAGEAELLTIATHPKYRRRGLAARCLAAFETEAQARDADVAFLEVAADNLGAIALYQRAGYHECGRRKGYYARKSGPPVDAVMMKKALT